MPFRRYCLRSPWVFSLLSRCHGLRGSQTKRAKREFFHDTVDPQTVRSMRDIERAAPKARAARVTSGRRPQSVDVPRTVNSTLVQ